jgi:type IV fimbrial biogenesis protein FimT
MGIPQEGYQPRQGAGFTLVECIAALIVASVLAAVAVPALSRMLARHQLNTAQLDLVATLQHARGLAVTSGRPKLFCPSTDGRHCAGALQWERGWAVGNDHGGHAEQLDGVPALVNGGYQRRALRITSNRSSIRFQPTGSASGSPVTFTLCRQGHTDDALAFTVSNMGRVAGATPTADAVARCAASN